MGCCASSTAALAETIGADTAHAVENQKRKASIAAEEKFDSKISAAAADIEFDASILSDRVYLRALRDTSASVHLCYDRWASANSTCELYLNHLAVFSQPPSFIGTEKIGEKVHGVAAKQARISALEKAFRTGKARTHLASISLAKDHADKGLAACKAYVDAEIALDALRKKVAAAEAKPSAKPDPKNTVKIAAAEALVAEKKSTALSLAPLAVTNAHKALMAAFSALRHGHKEFHDGVAETYSKANAELDPYHPSDSAASITEWVSSVGIGAGTLLSGVSLSGASTLYTNSMSQMNAMVRLLEMTISQLEAWKLTTGARTGVYFNMHSPDDEDVAIAELADTVKDEATVAMIKGATFPPDAHAAAKEAIQAAAVEFITALKSFLEIGIGVAMKAAETMRNAENDAASMEGKIKKAETSKTPPTEAQRKELHEKQKAAALARATFANTMSALGGKPAEAKYEEPPFPAAPPAAAPAVEVAPADEPATEPATEPAQPTPDEPAAQPEEKPTSPPTMVKSEEPTPSPLPSPPAETIHTGEVAPPLEVVAVMTVADASENFLKAMVEYGLARPVPEPGAAEPAEYARVMVSPPTAKPATPLAQAPAVAPAA